VGEKEHHYAMKWDEIAPLEYNTWPGLDGELDKIERKSESRIKKNDKFALINENALRLKEQRKETVYSLNLDEYRTLVKKREKESKKYKNIQKNPTGLQINPLLSEMEVMETDTLKAEKVNKWHKELAKDIYLHEAVSVVEDIIK
jgi:carboxyl-terminal processing protease